FLPFVALAGASPQAGRRGQKKKKSVNAYRKINHELTRIATNKIRQENVRVDFATDYLFYNISVFTSCSS
ncbi:MAG: hypothetical protein K9M57_04290, partial [Phycisphaerae bacterium]|nr:hypothetical protein [Phycisphaerae bacterium]